MEKIIDGLKHGMGFILVVGVFVFGLYLVKGVTFNEGEVITSTKLNSIVPSGFVGIFNGLTCPDGWDPADGVDDPKVGGGTSSLDLRGKFIRGLNSFDGGATVVTLTQGDQDGASRLLGSYQADEFKSHNHPLIYQRNFAGQSGIGGRAVNNRTGLSYNSPHYREDSNDMPYRGGTETRPKNVAVIFCVKE